MPVFLSIKNPVMDASLTIKQINDFFGALKTKVFDSGYDATKDHERIKEAALKDPSNAFDELAGARASYFSKDDWFDGMQAAGIDGVIRDVFRSPEYVAFNPNQAKSSTGNTGAFSREDNDIRYSIADPLTWCLLLT